MMREFPSEFFDLFRCKRAKLRALLSVEALPLADLALPALVGLAVLASFLGFWRLGFALAAQA
jgi:hypothetical protein